MSKLVLFGKVIELSTPGVQTNPIHIEDDDDNIVSINSEPMAVDTLQSTTNQNTHKHLYQKYAPHSYDSNNQPTNVLEHLFLYTIPYPPQIYSFPLSITNWPLPDLPDFLFTHEQFETVQAINTAHSQYLPTGERKGFLYCDDLGGSTDLSIFTTILDQWKKHNRQILWFTTTPLRRSMLTKQLKTFILDIPDHKIFNFSGNTDARAAKTSSQGILFILYQSISHTFLTKLQKYISWFDDTNSKKFEGLIIFDEFDYVYKLSREIKFEQNLRSKISPSESTRFDINKTLVQFLEFLPQSRVIYCSNYYSRSHHPGAEILPFSPICYRLGIWRNITKNEADEKIIENGPIFNSFSAFFEASDKAGVQGREWIVAELKRKGLYSGKRISLAQSKMQIVNVEEKQFGNAYDFWVDFWNNLWDDIKEKINNVSTKSDKDRNSLIASIGNSHQKRFFEFMRTFVLERKIAGFLKLWEKKRAKVKSEKRRRVVIEISDPLLYTKGTLDLLQRYFAYLATLRSIVPGIISCVQSRKTSISDKSTQRKYFLYNINPIDRLINKLGGISVTANFTGCKSRSVKNSRTGVWSEEKSPVPFEQEFSLWKSRETSGKKIAVTSKDMGCNLKLIDQDHGSIKLLHFVLDAPKGYPGTNPDDAVCGITTKTSGITVNRSFYFIVADVAGEEMWTHQIANRMAALGCVWKKKTISKELYRPLKWDRAIQAVATVEGRTKFNDAGEMCRRFMQKLYGLKLDVQKNRMKKLEAIYTDNSGKPIPGDLEDAQSAGEIILLDGRVIERRKHKDKWELWQVKGNSGSLIFTSSGWWDKILSVWTKERERRVVIVAVLEDTGGIKTALYIRHPTNADSLWTELIHSTPTNNNNNNNNNNTTTNNNNNTNNNNANNNNAMHNNSTTTTTTTTTHSNRSDGARNLTRECQNVKLNERKRKLEQIKEQPSTIVPPPRDGMPEKKINERPKKKLRQSSFIKQSALPFSPALGKRKQTSSPYPGRSPTRDQRSRPNKPPLSVNTPPPFIPPLAFLHALKVPPVMPFINSGITTKSNASVNNKGNGRQPLRMSNKCSSPALSDPSVPSSVRTPPFSPVFHNKPTSPVINSSVYTSADPFHARSQPTTGRSSSRSTTAIRNSGETGNNTWPTTEARARAKAASDSIFEHIMKFKDSNMYVFGDIYHPTVKEYCLTGKGNLREVMRTLEKERTLRFGNLCEVAKQMGIHDDLLKKNEKFWKAVRGEMVVADDKRFVWDIAQEVAF